MVRRDESLTRPIGVRSGRQPTRLGIEKERSSKVKTGPTEGKRNGSDDFFGKAMMACLSGLVGTLRIPGANTNIVQYHDDSSAAQPILQKPPFARSGIYVIVQICTRRPAQTALPWGLGLHVNRGDSQTTIRSHHQRVLCDSMPWL